MFGALRDGVTDDSAAINAAIQSLPATGGRSGVMMAHISLGPRIYRSNLTIEGQNTTVFKRSFANSGSLFLCPGNTNVDNVTLRDFTIDGNKAAMGSIRCRPYFLFSGLA